MNYKYISTILLAASLLLAAGPAVGAVPDEVKAIPVQYEGRVMPFASFAREALLGITGKMKWEGEDPSATLLHWMAHPEGASSLKLLEAGYEPLRKEAGLDLKRTRFSLDELLGARKIMELGAQSAQIRRQDGKPSKLESEAEKVLGRMGHLYALLTAQSPSFIPDAQNPHGEWKPVSDETLDADPAVSDIKQALTQMTGGYSQGDDVQLKVAALTLDRLIREEWKPDAGWAGRFKSETAYNKYHPIQLGRTLYLIALLMLLVSLVRWGGFLVPAAGWVLGAGWAAHIGGLLLRAHIGSRAPWSNFYESLVTITAVLVLFGILFSKRQVRGLVLGGVAFSGYFALLIADRAGLSPGVETLVPALQSYWLNIHVIVILSGYAVAALAMLLGHAALGVEALKPGDRSLFVSVTNSIYRAVQVAMLLLFAGTILGGVWAHEAWGRYWGWDPKETWALISWFGYVGVAHARFAGWLKPRGLALAAIGVFPIILMTYYGVNYLLSGLHSYAGGESAAVPPLLIGFLVLEAGVIFAGSRGWHVTLGGKLTGVRVPMGAVNAQPGDNGHPKVKVKQPVKAGEEL